MASEPVASSPRTLKDYFMPTFNWRSCIVIPDVQGSFQLDLEWVQMLPTFYGKSDENPYLHIYEFIDLCKIIGINQVNQEVVRLKLFPLSLKDKAKSWLYSLLPESIHSWEQLAQKFLEKYFPRCKIIQLRREIMNFAQGEQDPFYKAWERFEKLLSKCPDHGVTGSMQVYCFYDGLALPDKRMVDSACGGTLMNKTRQEAFDLFDSLANDQRWENRGTTMTGVYDVDDITRLVDKISVLQNKLETIMHAHGIPPSNQKVCSKCSDPTHPMELCPSSASFPEFSKEQNDPYSNNAYNLCWKNPTFSLNQQEVSRSPLEDLCAQLEQATQQTQNTMQASISKFPSQPERKFDSKTILGSNLRSFSYEEIREATNEFKEELGQGAFGVIYKGVMQIYSGVELVAVKKLNYVLHDIEKEFMTELNALGQTHHKNLVRLFGYCDEGQHRLLVHEFLSNGTLASFLFTDVKPSWRQRIEIAHGVARALLYLHEECSTQIIHCDIKPENILLDDYYNARISDFGLAVLTMNESQIHTAIRGTKGYVAPEWFHMLPITTKVDVYSFGIVLLEIISCKRSVDVESNCKEKANLTDWVYSCYVNGELCVVVDYEPQAFLERWKLQNFVMVAIWCIQEDPSLRPTMRKVVQMLEGKVEVNVPPCPFPYARTG